jgi:two-component system, LytTR family, sensor kinase
MTQTDRTIDLSDRPAPLGRVWLMVGAWAMVSLLQAVTLSYHNGLPFTYSIISVSLDYSVMASLVWVSCRLNARLRLWSRPPLRALAAYLGLGLAGIVIWCSFFLLAMRMFVGPNFWSIVFAATWMFQLLAAMFTYAAAFALGLVVQTFDREHESREREARLEAVAHAAEIEAIKGQLRPHFLLNSLNSILALVDDEPAEARRMIGRLSSLLHTVFDGLDEPFVPLERELAIVRDYLEVERIRFGDRLQFSVDADPAATSALVPPLLLQPLVENAVRHGIEPNLSPGRLRVHAQVERGRLQIRIANTMTSTNGRGGTGRGLELTRHRLRAVYGEERVGFEAGPDATGFTASLDLPGGPRGA